MELRKLILFKKNDKPSEYHFCLKVVIVPWNDAALLGFKENIFLNFVSLC